MKKYYETIWFYIISFTLVVFVLTVSTGQEKQQKKQLPVADSTINLKDLQAFNEVLRKSVSYDQYVKLNPEQVLTELWNWKLNEIKKQLADTTKKK